MEFAVGLFSSMAPQTAAAAGLGTAATVGEATAFIAAPWVATADTILSGGFTALSALSSIAQGQAMSNLYTQQANVEELAARQELLQGRAVAVQQLRDLNEAVGSIRAAGYASGLAGSGSVNQAAQDAIERGNFAIDLTRDTAAMRAGARRTRAAGLRFQGGFARRMGVWQAFETATTYLMSTFGRGLPSSGSSSSRMPTATYRGRSNPQGVVL